MTGLEQAAEMRPASRGAVPDRLPETVLTAIATGFLIYNCAWLSLAFTHRIGHVAPIWLPNALWLAVLMRNASTRWPWLIAAGVAANLTADLWFGYAPALAFVLTGANTLEVVLATLGMGLVLKGRLEPGRLSDLGLFGALAIACSAASAALGGVCLSLVNHAPLWRNFALWTASDALGLFILTPPVIALAQGEMQRLFGRRVLARTLLVLAALLGAIAVACAMPQHPLMMLTAPLLMLAALQLELGGAAMGMLVVSAAAAAFVAAGWPPFLMVGRSAAEQIYAVQGFLLVMSVMTFPIGAVLARRRELEAELTRSRDALGEINRLDRMAERLAGIGHWRVELGGGHFTWSDQMYRIYGLDPAEGPPSVDAALERVHPEDREEVQRRQRDYVGQEAPDLEVRIIRPDGEVRHVLVRSMMERAIDGGQVARFGTLTDVTELRQAAAAALASEQRYRFLADNAPDMIVRTSLSGGMVYVSPSSSRVFGYSPEEMMLLNAQDMVHPEDAEMVMGQIHSLIAQRQRRLPEALQYRAKHKSGDWIWIEANPTLIYDQRGEPLEFIDIVRNITQAKLFEAELDEARRRAEAAAAAKSAFLANMSHELRTPLTSIIGFSRLMSDQAELPAQARHYTGRIRDASEALLSIINDVLDFSKLEDGQVELERQPLAVRRLFDEASGLLAIQAEAKGLSLSTKVERAVPDLVEGDVARLRQVLLNFLSNAVKFTDKGGVEARASYAGGRLRVEIADTGAGIAEENLDRLFERFSQAEVSINRTHGGTGLGLAICKGIIELMGGTIGVETAPGLGSTFWFEIPAAPAAPVAATPVEHADVPTGRPLKLLVVDDTDVNRELVKLMLEPLGFVVREAGGGSDGIQAAMTEAFDVILMDVRMPGIDGLDATKVIRASSPFNARTPVLALTADVQPENAASCRAAGMNDVLAKPIVPAQLISKIVEWGDPEASDADEADELGFVRSS